MTNLLRSDFYRLFKSKSLYICTTVALFLTAANILVLYWASQVIGEDNAIFESLPFKDGISYGLSSFSNGNNQMIIAIFTAIFVTAEFSHGTMKNVVSKGFSKVHIYLSKLISMVTATYLILIANLIVGTITASFVLGTAGDFSGAYVGDILKIAGIELLLNAAMAAILVLVAMVIRNLGGVIAVDIVGVMSVGVLIYSVLELLIKSKINFNDYSLFNNIAFYYSNNAAKGTDFLRSAIVALVYLAATTALGIFAFKKSDVK